MRQLRVVAWLVAAILLGSPAAAQDGKKRSDKPGFSLTTKSKAKTADEVTEETVLANIDNQKMILDLEDPASADYARMVVALADFYWDLSESYFRKSGSDRLEQAIYDAEERKDEASLAKYNAIRQEYLDKQREFQQKTVDEYRRVVRDYPKSREADEFRYYLGYHLSAMGRAEEGRAAYQELIRQHPDSPYAPDALVNIGEYYFEDNDYENALKLYEAVEQQFPNAPIVGYAIYKQAWCDYNLGAYDVALSKLLAVIKRATAHERAGIRGAIELRKEAQDELIYPYAKVGKPEAAVTFFKRYAPNRFLELAGTLAALYTEQTEFLKSDKLLRQLIKDARQAKEGGPDKRHLVVRFQRQIVDNAYRRADKPSTVAAIQELIRQVEGLRVSAPSAFLSREEKIIQELVLNIATSYHAEYESTKEQQTLEMTQLLYDEYLRIFREGDNIYAITMNNALLMLLTGKYDQAAPEFEKVIAMRPEGQYADQAAERAVVAYLKSFTIKDSGVKNEATEDLERRPLEPDAARFVKAVDRWMELIARRGPSEDTADNIPPARFAAAKVLYDANHFEAAAERFARFVEEHPDHPYWEDAARHVLSSYNLAHDADGLRKYALLYEQNPRLMATDLAVDVRRIKNEFDYLECFKFEKRAQPLAAAECFIKYADTYGEDARAPAALFNAGVNYFKARRVERALETQKKLYDKYASNELAPKALYSIGEIFRETTVYDQAAYIYEVFVANHKGHPLAEKALRYASIFRKTLGEYDKAVDNLELYLRRYPDAASAPRVHLDIVKIRETQNRPTYVLATVRDHLRMYKEEPPSVRLQVLNMRGKAYKALDKRRDAPKAFLATVESFRGLDEAAVGELTLPALSAVAEAHFNLGEAVLARARAVKLTGDEKKLAAAIQSKLTLLNEAKTVYEQVIAYGHPGWTIAAYTQLGLAYRDLANAVENVDVPRRLKHLPDAVEEFKTVMAERATPIRERAVASYRRALEIARKDHWFNAYSERAEQAIAQLDLEDVSIKEFRLRPDRTGPNTGRPEFKQEAR